MPAWPATLPAAPLAEGMKETMPDTTLRTRMDQGPAKTRRRTTAGAAQLSLVYLVSRAQLDDLAAFHDETLAGGALSFDFTHPRTAETVSCRFRQPPAWAAVNGAWFRAAVELEVLP